MQSSYLELITVSNYTFYCIFVEIDNCDSNPCKNGGRCKNGFATFSCTCPDGFTGNDCGISMLKVFQSNRFKPTIGYIDYFYH